MGIGRAVGAGSCPTALYDLPMPSNPIPSLASAALQITAGRWIVGQLRSKGFSFFIILSLSVFCKFNRHKGEYN